MFKNALVSVSDKTGLVDFIGPLAEKGMRVVSTGGTAKLLKEQGIPVVELSEQTGSPEVMGGRVKSLHPNVYMPLLARENNPADSKVLKEAGLAPFDLVVCNLYPFEKKKSEGVEDLVEWIDVGGPSLIRAAAKNFKTVTVLSDPKDYASISKLDHPPTLEKRKQFAAQAFSKLVSYNISIATWLQGESQEQDLYLKAPFHRSLRYGENPEQKGGWFRIQESGLHKALLIQGKALSYNNICDLNAAVNTMREFKEPCSVAIKHSNPCGVALGKDIKEACERALKADPMSVFGGVLALNGVCSEEVAELLCSLFLEAVIAPDYTPEAIKFFANKKKNLRILKWPELTRKSDALKLQSVDGGLLMQTSLKATTSWSSDWEYTQKKPDTSTQSDLLMAWRVVTHLKSNAIAFVSKGQTVGLGMGQVNRVSAVETGLQRWKKHHPAVQEAVMASDGFFPFSDSIELAHKAGCKWIIQPGGSLKDKQVISKAKELGVSMVFTGQRRFSH